MKILSTSNAAKYCNRAILMWRKCNRNDIFEEKPLQNLDFK